MVAFNLETLLSDLLSDEEFHEFNLQVKKFVNYEAYNSPGIMPCLFVAYKRNYGEKPEYAVFYPKEWADYNTRIAVLRAVARKVISNRWLPTAITLVSEAWISVQPKGGKRMLPHDDPNRQESVILTSSALGGRHCLLSAEIIRAKDNKISLGKFEDISFESIESSILDYFFSEVLLLLQHKVEDV